MLDFSLPKKLAAKVEAAAIADGVTPQEWVLMCLSAEVARMENLSVAGSPPNSDWIESVTARGLPTSFKYNANGGILIRAGHKVDGPSWDVSAKQLEFARQKVKQLGRLFLGASRDKPVPSSLGGLLLKEFGVNNASYIAVVLREEGLIDLELAPDGTRTYVIVLKGTGPSQ